MVVKPFEKHNKKMVKACSMFGKETVMQEKAPWTAPTVTESALHLHHVFFGFFLERFGALKRDKKVMRKILCI